MSLIVSRPQFDTKQLEPGDTILFNVKKDKQAFEGDVQLFKYGTPLNKRKIIGILIEAAPLCIDVLVYNYVLGKAQTVAIKIEAVENDFVEIEKLTIENALTILTASKNEMYIATEEEI